ncbi:MAG: hypothetical protein LBM00_11105 [Deltaproteobacteria bacterium]|nr:hypothetical protein [Deltaproteobacteria bacterium]
MAYFDVRKGEEFYAYARSKNVVDVQNLPPVDFYSENGSLKVIDRKFDLVFSSHCIEHTYDIVGHVNDVEGILNEGGVYCLIVPDKRYCFDHFRSVSSLGDIIGRACDKNTEYHSLKVFVDSLVRTHNDSARHWNRDNGVAPSPSPEVILQKIDEWKTMKGKNPGPHAWVFTDESFSENFSSLHAAGITKLTPVRVYNTPRNSNGFCVVMKRAVL